MLFTVADTTTCVFNRNIEGMSRIPETLSKANGPGISGVSPASVRETLSVPTAGILDPFTLPLKGIKESRRWVDRREEGASHPG